MMKIIIAFILTLGIANIAFAQNQYEVLIEGKNEKSLKGIISQEVLLNDTSFRWYADNLKGYTPNASALAGLKKHADSLQLLVFMGTWCEDSHSIIPKFYSLLETSGFSKQCNLVFRESRRSFQNFIHCSKLRDSLKTRLH